MDLIEIIGLTGKKLGKLPYFNINPFHGRVEVIQRIINKMGAKFYLEIGVAEGRCFLQINAFRKLGVDPKFLISKKKKILSLLINPLNLFNKYFEISSDFFFKSLSSLEDINPIDIIFIDGLHTYQQSLRDVQNSLKYLAKGGTIVMHDCNPWSKRVASPINSISGKKPPGKWLGDVWKTIVYLKSIRNDLNVFVLNFDRGVGVVSKSHINNSDLDLSEREINLLNFKDLDSNRKKLLNLKNEHYLSEYIKNISVKHYITSKIYSILNFGFLFTYFWITIIFKILKSIKGMNL